MANSPKTTDPDRYKNRAEALGWLQNQGYKISKAKFYADCSSGQKISMGRDGTLSKWQVHIYAANELMGGTESGGTDLQREQCRKVKAEADLKELQFQIAIRQRDKYWLHADDAWASIAALIGTLRDAITHYLHEGARDVVTIAGGDQERSHEVFEGVEQLINAAFNEVAGNEINVEFERAIEDSNPEEAVSE